MKSECIEALIATGREIEFEYQGERYSITYYNDNREKYISVCRFYDTPIDARNAGEVLKMAIRGRTLKQIFSELPDSAFDIY